MLESTRRCELNDDPVRTGAMAAAGPSDWFSNDVSFSLVAGDIDGLKVRSLQISERLSTLSEAAITAVYAGPRVEPRELLSKDCALTIERPGRIRHFRGVISSAHVDEALGGTRVRLNVVPALWLLSRRRDSRIFQDKTVAEVVQEIMKRLLESRGRRVRVDCSETYEKHEYLVQYHESDFDFISRILDREGIFFYFDHDEDEQEVLVLADTVSNLQRVREEAVPFAKDPHRLPDREGVSHLIRYETVDATDAVVAGFDWTNPGLDVRAEKLAKPSAEPPLERYRHREAVTYHQYSQPQYGSNSARAQAEMDETRMALARERWQMGTSVITAAAGRVIQVSGEGDLDGTYVVVSSAGRGVATAGQQGSWASDCEVVPTGLGYKPPLRGAGPVVPGLETAVVVGPSGEEIYTDEHGRIKVQFHWDRQGKEDENSSCWIRVMQSWAGPGYGTFFLPRIGMEVAVSFLGGDPERPVVIGCLYNGKNHAPASPPDQQKTHSVIRSKSSLHSEGFNELRFEDPAGSERIYVHAERDFIKDVKHDRKVDVGNDERIKVHRNREAEVKGTETVEVHGERKKIQHENEREVFDNKFDSQYGGHRSETYLSTHEDMRIGSYVERYMEPGGYTHTAEYSAGGFVQRFLGGEAFFHTYVALSGGWGVADLAASSIWLNAVAADGQVELGASNKVVAAMLDSSAKVELTPNRLSLTAGTIKLRADTEIELQVGGSSIKLLPSAIILNTSGSLILTGGGGITAMGSTVHTISGTFNVLAGNVTRNGPPTWD
jgi:type VI secretion system secreted protein VgrG